jgi:murein DD-endopeptidase MepM/ murein hydrolase activator NlpD
MKDSISAENTKEQEVSDIIISPKLIWPLRNIEGTVTQGFGEHAIDYSAYGLIGHNGRDIAAPKGTTIQATHPGQCWCYEDPGYGKVVEVWYPNIEHGIFKTISAHMDFIGADDKSMVNVGDSIGLLGSTGNSTGPHVHFGLKLLGGVNPGYRNWIDPVPFMDK